MLGKPSLQDWHPDVYEGFKDAAASDAFTGSLSYSFYVPNSIVANSPVREGRAHVQLVISTRHQWPRRMSTKAGCVSMRIDQSCCCSQSRADSPQPAAKLNVIARGMLAPSCASLPTRCAVLPHFACNNNV